MNKSAFLIGPDEWDQMIIEDLSTLDYSLFAVSWKDILGLRPAFNHPQLKENRIYRSTEREINNLLFNTRHIVTQCIKMIKDKNISFIVPTHSTNGIQYLIIGFLNHTFGLPGLNRKQTGFWYRKSRYLKYFKSLGFKVPSIFQIVPMKEYPDMRFITSFPAICKPECGTGGDGVYLAHSPEELIAFFQPAPKDEVVKEITKLLRNRDQFGRMRNYLFTFIRSNYLIEEFIPGPVISVSGIKAVNGVEISLIYEIKPSDPPFRSENEFLVPFSDKKIIKMICSVVSQMVKESVFPYGPFVLDFILDPKNTLRLIDASPRFSSTALQFFNPCYGDTSYVERSIKALWGKKIDIQVRNNPLVYAFSKRLPLPKGRLINFSQTEPFSECVIDWKIPLKPGDEIYRERNDFLSARRGRITVTGKSIQEAEQQWLKEYKKLDFLIKEIM